MNRLRRAIVGVWSVALLVSPAAATASLLEVDSGVELVDEGPGPGKGALLRDAAGHVVYQGGAPTGWMLRCEGLGVVKEKHLQVWGAPPGSLLATWFGLSSDGQDVLAAVRIDDKLRLVRFRCGVPDDVVLDVDVKALPLDTKLGTGPIGNPALPRRMWEGQDGALCLGDAGGVRCFAKDGSLSRDVQIEAFVKAVAIDPRIRAELLESAFAWAGPTGYVEPKEAFGLRAFGPKPDGGVVAILRHVLYRGFPKEANLAGLQGETDWLVELRPDGTVVPRSVAWNGGACTTGNGPLATVDSLSWQPDLGLMAAYPVRGWNAYATAETGTGVLLLSPDDLGFGYVELARRLTQAAGTASLGKVPAAWLAPDGAIRLELGGRTLRVALDLGALDLDSDGLDGKAETAAKSSPFWADSDAGGTNDGVEVQVSGTDPTLRTDDPARFETPAWYVSSGLVGLRLLAGPGADPWGGPSQGATVGGPPFCTRGRCVDASGALQFSIPSKDWRPRLTSWDGRYLLGADPDEPLRLLRVQDQTWVMPKGGDGVKPTGTIEVLDEAEVYAWTHKSRWLQAFGAGAGEVVLDLDGLACEEGLYCPDKGQNNGKDLLRGEVIGFDAARGVLRVQVWVGSVAGVRQGWILGVRHGQSTVVLEKPAQAFGFGQADPRDLFQRCDIQSPQAQPRFEPTLPGEGVQGSLRVGYALTAAPGSAHLPFAHASDRTRAWDGTLIQTWTLGPYPDWLESVRYEPGLEPGDVVALEDLGAKVEDFGKMGAMLWRSGPRGGQVALWSTPLRDIETRSIDISADRTLCIAASRGMLVVMRPRADSRGVPVEIVAQLPIAGLQACSFGSDGALFALADGPARLLRVDDVGPNVHTTLVEALGDGAAPRGLVIDGMGKPHIRRLGDGMLGLGRSATGGLVEIPGVGSIRVDGVPLGVDAREVFERTPARPAADNHAHLHEYAVVQRPDGLIQLVGQGNPAPTSQLQSAGIPWVAVAPNSGAVAHVHPWAGNPMALAIVPGGAAVDPWTGAPLPLGGITAADGSGGGAPDGGKTDGGASGDGGGGGDGGGCQSRPGRAARPSAALALVAALVLAALAWPRRRAGRRVRVGRSAP